MGARGPAPMPTKLKVLRGETRPSRVNRNEPAAGGRPRMPADMSEDSKRVWRRVIRDFGSSGVLTGADTDALRAYCEAVARYVQAARTLEQSGPLVRGARHGELIKNPLHQVVRDNAILIRAFARELGLTPSARSGLEVAKPEVVDAFEKWVTG